MFSYIAGGGKIQQQMHQFLCQKQTVKVNPMHLKSDKDPASLVTMVLQVLLNKVQEQSQINRSTCIRNQPSSETTNMKTNQLKPMYY